MGFLQGIEWKTVVATLVIIVLLGMILGRK